MRKGIVNTIKESFYVFKEPWYRKRPIEGVFLWYFLSGFLVALPLILTLVPTLIAGRPIDNAVITLIILMTYLILLWITLPFVVIFSLIGYLPEETFGVIPAPISVLILCYCAICVFMSLELTLRYKKYQNKSIFDDLGIDNKSKEREELTIDADFDKLNNK